MRSKWLALFAVLSASVGALDCSNTELGDTPFRCEGDGLCPAGYRCVSNVCARNGISVPARLSSTVDDSDGAFSVHARSGDLLVCWNSDVAAREPGIFAATLSPAGDVVLTPRALYTTDFSGVHVITGVRGDCNVHGDTVVVGAIRLNARFRYVFRVFAADPMSGASRLIANFEQYPFNELTHFASATVGDQTWFVYPHFEIKELDDSVGFNRLVVDGRQQSTNQRTTLPTAGPGTRVNSTELLTGDGGVWVSVLYASGRSDFVWMTPEGVATLWVRQPVENYIAAYPLAVRGKTLAVAYHLSGNAWQIQWIEHIVDPDGGMDAFFSPSRSHPGPSFTLPEDVIRPGGLADGDNLLVAGAVDGNHVTVWSAPWDGTDALATIGTAPKLSHVVPRRLALARVAGQLQAVWTERIPQTENGFTAYAALLAASVEIQP